MVTGRSEDGQGLEKKLAKMETLLEGYVTTIFPLQERMGDTGKAQRDSANRAGLDCAVGEAE